jgi:hypothetical protein
MSRGAQTFKQGDLTKAAKGVAKAGLPVQRVEIDRDGKIVVIVGKPSAHPEIEDAASLIG